MYLSSLTHSHTAASLLSIASLFRLSYHFPSTTEETKPTELFKIAN
ncbi:hypothetical protein PRUPE_1G071600 [Prunus persica]|uniref:Uncharacterized protein n=1 Tax=Prunus persica TaxID=3760 RepID=A0A251QTU3_PRUPE|nr:hypothetical protein PRUPE_7G208000 [Prunus persica]ONI27163.1 hypothetical protein PRUPE_1G071600 [Prunus persica]